MANEHSIAHPYANALFEIAKDTDTLDIWLSDLKCLAEVAQNAEFIGLIRNPKLNQDKILEVLFGFLEQVKQPLKQLLALLQENNRLEVLPQIYTIFQQKVQEERNAACAIIQSAFVMSDIDRKKCEQKLSSKFGKSITATVEIHPELIGGIKVLINDTVIDASVKGSLENLATKLIS